MHLNLTWYYSENYRYLELISQLCPTCLPVRYNRGLCYIEFYFLGLDVTGVVLVLFSSIKLIINFPILISFVTDIIFWVYRYHFKSGKKFLLGPFFIYRYNLFLCSCSITLDWVTALGYRYGTDALHKNKQVVFRCLFLLLNNLTRKTCL